MTGLPNCLRWLSIWQHKTKGMPMTSIKRGKNDSKRSKVHENYRDNQESAIKDQELRRQMAAKALDIPYDTMGDINVQNTSSLKGVIAGAVMAAGLMGGSIVVGHFLSKTTPQIIEKTVEKIKVFDSDISMEIIPPE